MDAKWEETGWFSPLPPSFCQQYISFTHVQNQPAAPDPPTKSSVKLQCGGLDCLTFSPSCFKPCQMTRDKRLQSEYTLQRAAREENSRMSCPCPHSVRKQGQNSLVKLWCWEYRLFLRPSWWTKENRRVQDIQTEHWHYWDHKGVIYDLLTMRKQGFISSALIKWIVFN